MIGCDCGVSTLSADAKHDRTNIVIPGYLVKQHIMQKLTGVSAVGVDCDHACVGQTHYHVFIYGLEVSEVMVGQTIN